MNVFAQLFIAVTLMTLGAQAVESQHPHFSQVQSYQIQPQTYYKEKSPLTIIHMTNSQWTTQEVLERVRRTENIFAQCELSFEPITIVTLHHKLGTTVDLDHLEEYFDIQYLIDLKQLKKPFTIMMDSESTGHYGGGASIRRSMVQEGDPLSNITLLFSSFAKTEERSFSGIEASKLGYYEVMAHELAHVLFDYGHVMWGNDIMSYSSNRTNVIEPWECERIGAPPPKPGSSVSTFQ